MKRHLILTSLACFVILFFASCGNKNNLVGTWIQPKADGSAFEDQGFTLLQDGSIVCINTGFTDYQSWEKSGNQLIIKGAYTGTNPRDFCDTMNIVEITAEKLVLEQAGYEISYERR